jgi:hypothetical protein
VRATIAFAQQIPLVLCGQAIQRGHPQRHDHQFVSVSTIHCILTRACRLATRNEPVVDDAALPGRDAEERAVESEPAPVASLSLILDRKTGASPWRRRKRIVEPRLCVLMSAHRAWT